MQLQSGRERITAERFLPGVLHYEHWDARDFSSESWLLYLFFLWFSLVFVSPSVEEEPLHLHLCLQGERRIFYFVHWWTWYWTRRERSDEVKEQEWREEKWARKRKYEEKRMKILDLWKTAVPILLYARFDRWIGRSCLSRSSLSLSVLLLLLLFQSILFLSLCVYLRLPFTTEWDDTSQKREEPEVSTEPMKDRRRNEERLSARGRLFFHSVWLSNRSLSLPAPPLLPPSQAGMVKGVSLYFLFHVPLEPSFAVSILPCLRCNSSSPVFLALFV